MARVAALYVDPHGVYAGLPDVDVWDEARDARLYDGPWPVVAHPPCARWCAIAHLVEQRYGYKVGDDGGTFAAALKAVRRFGGVLEHPAYSRAWTKYGLPRPGRQGWTRSLLDPGYVTEIDQHVYGHPGRKRTWLYFVGDDPPALRWEHAPGGLPLVSFFDYTRGERARDGVIRIRAAQASATPVELRDVLLSAVKGRASAAV